MEERLEVQESRLAQPDHRHSELIERAKTFRPIGLILEKIKQLNELEQLLLSVDNLTPERVGLCLIQMSRLLPNEKNRPWKNQQLHDVIARIQNMQITQTEIDEALRLVDVMRSEYEVLQGEMLLALTGTFTPGQIVTDNEGYLFCVLSASTIECGTDDKPIQEVFLCSINGKTEKSHSTALTITNDETDYVYFLQQLRQTWHEFGPILDLEIHFDQHLAGFVPNVENNQPLIEADKRAQLLEVRRGEVSTAVRKSSGSVR